MIRTALRLAAVAALTSGGAGPWPTQAGKYVYDSRRDDIDDIKQRMRQPVIVVRTEDDRQNNSAMGTYTKAQTRVVDLQLEVSVVVAEQDVPVDGSRPRWLTGLTATDSSLEARLDMLEFQIESAFFGGGNWATWFAALPWARVEKMSIPQYTREPIATRLAARTLNMRMQIMPPGECLAGWRLVTDLPTMAVMPVVLKSVMDKILTDGAGDLKIMTQQLKDILESGVWPIQGVYPQLRSVPIDVGIAGR